MAEVMGHVKVWTMGPGLSNKILANGFFIMQWNVSCVSKSSKLRLYQVYCSANDLNTDIHSLHLIHNIIPISECMSKAECSSSCCNGP